MTKNPITKDIVVLKNEEAIKQSVKNLVLTQIGERHFSPLLGTNTTSYLFELSTGLSENALIEEIEDELGAAFNTRKSNILEEEIKIIKSKKFLETGYIRRNGDGG